MLNPLSPRKHIRLPRLPKWSQIATLQASILSLETATSAESFVVITFFPEKTFAALESLPVSMWHLGSQSDWTTLPSEDFWCNSSEHMQIYLGQDLPAPPHPVALWLSWVIGMGNSSLLEGEDRLFFVILEEKEVEVVELTLHSFVGDIWQPIPWERAPEFRNKIILFSPGNCIVTEEHASSGLDDLRANNIYFL
jgi:hypothetical protein